jgi:CheY-like chemotaxis protein
LSLRYEGAWEPFRSFRVKHAWPSAIRNGGRPLPEHPAPPETILFVEDEALIRMDMAEFLRECGYRVHEAANASEAVEALESKFAVALAFTDVNLPEGMNGLELAEWIFNNRPGVKVVVTSGDAPRTEVPRTVQPLLVKPYTGRDLLDRIKRALGQQSDDEPTGSSGRS